MITSTEKVFIMASSTPVTIQTSPGTTAPTTESSTTVHALSNTNQISEIQKCLTLLDEGKQKVITNQTDVVSLLGMTGSGKTTLVKFLATNNSRLRSEEMAENIGEYVIEDLDGDIGSVTLRSKTIFPKLYLDPETQIVFYDGPGFSDTRGLAEDLAGAYFTHKVISESQKIRFILTVNYSSVRRGMDRGDFLELLKHTLHLLKNINPYLDSIGLVVTKVDNQMMKKNGELVLVPDNIVIENIAKFLLDFKSSIPSVAHGSIAQDMGKLVDALLHKKDLTYEKITLFRRPEEAGLLSNIESLQGAKIVIKKVIRENLKQANINKEDFGIAISEQSKNKLQDLMAAINDNITSAIRDLCKSKMLIYGTQMAKSTDIFETYKMLKNDFETLRNWLSNKTEDINLQNFLDSLQGVGKNMKVGYSDEEMLHVLQQGEYIPFLETVNGKKFQGSMLFWKMGLLPYLNWLEESSNWYKFLTVWHNVLSSHSVQKKQNDFIHLFEHRVTDLHDEQFVKLLTFCKTLTGELDRFQSVLMDSTKADQFNKLLERTLKNDTISTYDEKTKTLVVHGKYVKLGELLNIQKNLSEAHFIKLFASDKLFIDVNFNRLNNNLQTLYLAAPTWEVIGAVHIKLDGEKSRNAYQYKARDGDRYSKDGLSGRPGVPGNSSANFVGLADTVINDENLKITTNGGEGGAGQDGGNGNEGYDGASPITKYSWGCSGNNYDQFAYQKIGGVVRGVYCIYGQRGGDGGNGGNGGIGGYGGQPGKIVFPLKQPSNIRTEAKKGAAGAHGMGGEGGQGGKAGRSWNHQTMFGSWREASCSRSQSLADEYGDCANNDYFRNGHRGENGSPGANYVGRLEAGYTILINSEAAVTEYRQFLQQESNNDSISQLSKMEFLNKLNNMSVNRLPPPIRYKRMAPLPVKQFTRHGLLHNDKPKWINGDGFQKPQWPIIEKIGQTQGTTDLALTSVPFTDFLLLTDLLIRKLNQTKPNYFQSCRVDDVAVTGCAIHILSIFEKTLAKIQTVKDGEPINVDIDPVVMIEKLEKEIRNGSPQNIIKILLDSSDNEISEHKDELSRLLFTELQLDSE